jgi:hypothetical protein
LIDILSIESSIESTEISFGVMKAKKVKIDAKRIVRSVTLVRLSLKELSISVI